MKDERDAPAAQECDTCHGTGQICVGTSSLESDGNAPELERCPECGYGDATAQVGYVAIGRNPFYEGLFHGETEKQRDQRLEDARIAEKMTKESLAAALPATPVIPQGVMGMPPRGSASVTIKPGLSQNAPAAQGQAVDWKAEAKYWRDACVAAAQGQADVRERAYRKALAMDDAPTELIGPDTLPPASAEAKPYANLFSVVTESGRIERYWYPADVDALGGTPVYLHPPASPVASDRYGALPPDPSYIGMTPEQLANALHPETSAASNEREALTDEQIWDIADEMVNTPWGIGSRREDAVAFARAILATRTGEPE